MSRWRHNKRHALAGKLVLMYLVGGVLMVILAGLTIRHGFHEHFRDTIRPHLVRYLEYVQQDIGIPPDRERAGLLAQQLNLEIYIFDAQGAWSSGGKPLDRESLSIESQFEQNGINYQIADDRHRHYLIGRRDDTELVFSLRRSRDESGGWRAIYPLTVVLILLAILFHLTRRLFRPIDVIEAGVKRFASGDLAHRIDVCRRDELGALAVSCNSMADDIQRMLDAKRQLLLAISHELRSPLTRAKVATDLLLDEKRRLQIQGDLNEIDELIGELLEIERLSTRHEVLHLSECDLGVFVSEFVAENYDARVTVSPVTDALPICRLDVSRIRLMLRNLLDNSLRHSPDNAPQPVVSVQRQEAYLVLQVQDSGEGIAEEHLAHVMEPFYRVDPARQRNTGGYGLGLFLCRMIAEAHGGSLELNSEPGSGTTVTAYLSCIPSD